MKRISRVEQWKLENNVESSGQEEARVSNTWDRSTDPEDRNRKTKSLGQLKDKCVTRRTRQKGRIYWRYNNPEPEKTGMGRRSQNPSHIPQQSGVDTLGSKRSDIVERSEQKEWLI